MLTSVAYAQVFKCESQGRTTYQDFPCEVHVAQKPSDAASSVADLDNQLVANALAERYDLTVDRECGVGCYRAPAARQKNFRTFRRVPLYNRRH
jgi:hypothetical protein